MKKVPFSLLIGLTAGWFLSGCNGPQESLSNTATQSLNAFPFSFRAESSNPVWDLTIDPDQGLQLRQTGEEEMSVRAPFPGRTIDKKTGELVLDAQTRAHHIVIRIREENCRVTRTDGSYPYKVQIVLDDRTELSGCGHLQGEAMELRSMWILSSMPGNDLREAPSIPELSIDLLFGRYSATDGCNSMGGDLSMKPNRPLFRPGPDTLMYCGNDFGQQFREWFMNVDGYRIRGQELLLYRDGEVALTYRQKPVGPDQVEKDLHGLWVVYSIGTTPIPKGSEEPRIGFYLAEGRVSGYTGCNHFNVKLEASEGLLRLAEAMVMTKKACPASVEESFLNAISRVSAYRRDEELLFLLGEQGKTLLSLQKTN